MGYLLWVSYRKFTTWHDTALPQYYSFLTNFSAVINSSYVSGGFGAALPCVVWVMEEAVSVPCPWRASSRAMMAAIWGSIVLSESDKNCWLYFTCWLFLGNIHTKGVIFVYAPSNERRRYILTSLIGWAHIQNNPRYQFRGRTVADDWCLMEEPSFSGSLFWHIESFTHGLAMPTLAVQKL